MIPLRRMTHGTSLDFIGSVREPEVTPPAVWKHPESRQLALTRAVGRLWQSIPAALGLVGAALRLLQPGTVGMTPLRALLSSMRAPRPRPTLLAVLALYPVPACTAASESASAGTETSIETIDSSQDAGDTELGELPEDTHNSYETDSTVGDSSDGSAADTEFLQYSTGSSGKRCLCWPDGDVCDFEHDERKASDPSKRCPESEVCTGGPAAAEDPRYGGYCVLPCFLPGADFVVEMSCADGWICVYHEVHWAFEDQYGLSFAACRPGPSG